jgi:hypothetical protein
MTMVGTRGRSTDLDIPWQKSPDTSKVVLLRRAVCHVTEEAGFNRQCEAIRV